MRKQTRSALWNRREVLELGAAAALGLARVHPPSAPSPTPGPMDIFRTALCDLLEIDYPLVQAPMGGVTSPEMIAAVGRAGGMGILAGVGMPPDELRRQIRRIRDLTDRPFGINLLLHTELYPPVDAATIPDSTVQAVHAVLNGFRRRLGLPESTARPPGLPDVIDAAFEVILEERVPVFSVGLGKPTPEMVQRCHAQGMKVMAMASTVPDAVALAETGADLIVAQGGEAGGHRSTWVKRASPEMASIGTMALVPQVVDAVPVPVIAAGGIMDGRQLVAALALGATGVLMGTRFIATAESAAPDFHKRALIERDSDATTLTDAFTGLYARVLRTAFTEEYAASGAPVLPGAIQQIAMNDIKAASTARGSGEYYPMYAGQGVGMIHELPGAADVVRAVIEEARGVMASLPERVRL